jgi:hypothetical protein
MKIAIRSSMEMTKLGENRVIRFADEVAILKQLERYIYLHSKCANGKQVILKSFPAYDSDKRNDAFSCYVSQDVYNMLYRDFNGLSEVKQVSPVTLGCDPEFFLLDSCTNQIVYASAVFKNKNGEVGYDGLLAELRPKPSRCEYQVCWNLWQLIQTARNELNGVHNFNVRPERTRFIGTSYLKSNVAMGFSAGFHLHFGLPKQLLRNYRYGTIEFATINKIIRILDFYVGIPSVIIEKYPETIRRTSPLVDYGKPGLFRIDNVTVEYRTPGGALLKHPVLAVGLLGLGGLVINDIVIKLSAITNSFDEMEKLQDIDIGSLYEGMIVDPYEIHKVICASDNNEALNYLNKIANDLTKMYGFEDRRRSVEPMLSMLCSGQPLNNDIEINWRKYYNGEYRKVQMEFLS